MNKRNISEVQRIEKEAKKEGISFFFHDDRWKERGDVDICVKRKDRSRLHMMLMRHGFRYFKINRYWKSFYLRYVNKGLIIFDVHLDRYEGIRKGIIDTDTVLYHLTAEKQLFFYIYRMGLGNKLEKYIKHIPKLYRDSDKSRLEGYLKETFTNYQHIMEQLSSKKYAFRPKFKMRYFFIRGLFFLRNQGFKMTGRISKLFRPGAYLVFLGSDGSGKTTTVERIMDICEKITIKRSFGNRFTFKCLPLNFLTRNMAKKAKKSGKAKGDVIEYKSGLIRYLVPFVYYLEYLLRYLFLTYPARVKNVAVIEDRHYLDLLTSKNADPKLVRMLYSLLPKPNKIIYLYNDPGTIMKRRRDHPKDDILFQQKRFKRYRSLFDMEVKTGNIDKDIDKIVNYIISNIRNEI